MDKKIAKGIVREIAVYYIEDMIEESDVKKKVDETESDPQLDPKGIMLKDIKARGAEVLKFDPDAAYLIVLDRKVLEIDEAGKIVKVLNERGIIADLILIDGKPQEAISLYAYQDTSKLQDHE